MMICLDCGHDKVFTSKQYIRIYAVEHVTYNGLTEEKTDVSPREEYDEDPGDPDALVCGFCDGENCLEDLDEKDILEIKWEHTNKKGLWSREELPKEKRNPELYKQLVALNI